MRLLLLLGVVVPATMAYTASPEPLRTFPAEEARQGVAVDATHVYAIDNRQIGKYDKFTGKRVGGWVADEGSPISHLNSGVVRDGKLICAHSNYGQLPMTSSLEVFDTATMEHVATHSFGVYQGSLTWYDYHEGTWWACFAHYAGKGGYPGKGPEYTTVVQFADDHRPRASWVLPPTVLDRMAPYSASGGAWGPDGRLYVSGHDRTELYVLRVPAAGSVLEHVDTLSFRNAGQAIAFDRSGSGLLYGIVRKSRTIVAAPVPEMDE